MGSRLPRQDIPPPTPVCRPECPVRFPSLTPASTLFLTDPHSPDRGLEGSCLLARRECPDGQDYPAWLAVAEGPGCVGDSARLPSVCPQPTSFSWAVNWPVDLAKTLPCSPPHHRPPSMYVCLSPHVSATGYVWVSVCVHMYECVCSSPHLCHVGTP